MFVKVSPENILKNVIEIKSRLGEGVRFCAVVKANAYGHGLAQVAEYIEEEADFFAVARLDEALLLRDVGIKKDILVLGAFGGRAEASAAARRGITLTLDCPQNVPVFAEAGVSVHIKTDSGMNRLGVKDAACLSDLIRLCADCGVRVTGVYSHFARGMATDPKAMFAQYKKFLSFAGIVREYYPSAIRHICNTAAALDCPAFHLDMVRIGIGLYGCCDSPRARLLPAKSAVATVVETKSLAAGESLGYDFAFTADRDMFYAVIDCGYGDGLPRRFARGGYVLTKYGKAEIIGNMCMDMTMVRDDKKSLVRGDKVVLLGDYGKNNVKADDIAKICDTIPYEILCNLRNR